MPFKSLTDEEYVALDVVDLGKGNTTIVIEEKVNNLKRNKKYRIMVKVLYNEDPNNLDSTKLKKISGIAPQYFYVNDLEFNEKNKTRKRFFCSVFNIGRILNELCFCRFHHNPSEKLL